MSNKLLLCYGCYRYAYARFPYWDINENGEKVFVEDKYHCLNCGRVSPLKNPNLVKAGELSKQHNN